MDERRIKACITYVIGDICFKNGDTYLNRNEIYKGISAYLKCNIEESLFVNPVQQYIPTKAIITVTIVHSVIFPLLS